MLADIDPLPANYSNQQQHRQQRMLASGSHPHLPTLPARRIFITTNPTTYRLIIPSSSSPPSRTITRLVLRSHFIAKRRRPIRTATVSCKSSSSSSSSSSDSNRTDGDDDLHDYLEASILVPETLLHYRMRRQPSSAPWYHSLSRKTLSFSGSRHSKNTSHVHRKESSLLIGQEFLRRFHTPTIFLKISCDPDFFLLPIIVGEFAIESLIDSISRGDDNADCPDQFQLVGNVVEKLQHKVKMVKITERVGNTYFARLCFGKATENEILSVDARPSDAINVASRCKAPIYVNKQIVSMDATRIGYGMGGRDKKSIYDVSLDSAIEGPDSVAEELDLLKNLNLAVAEERYIDAAIWRDKLMDLRKPRQERE